MPNYLEDGLLHLKNTSKHVYFPEIGCIREIWRQWVLVFLTWSVLYPCTRCLCITYILLSKTNTQYHRSSLTLENKLKEWSSSHIWPKVSSSNTIQWPGMYASFLNPCPAMWPWLWYLKIKNKNENTFVTENMIVGEKLQTLQLSDERTFG